ncbi:peptide deformylase [Phaeospirillum tilakii]|uniref:Peptide deformylase n=1 Tax=Phaeospirillum tilakii TaxID=741673 RepID=A0ABW5C8G4_9PROT
MAVLPIFVAPDPILKKKAQPVETVDQAIVTLLDDMLETMYAAPGIGLAAPQVGVSRRIIVLDIAKADQPRAPMRMVNPEIVWASDERNTYEEGCLSVPEQYAKVVRPKQVRARYRDETGAEREIEADGLLATVIQHEIDHLDGVLFVDHLSSLKKHMILRRLAKARKDAVAS